MDLGNLSGHCCAIPCRSMNGMTHAATGPQMWSPSALSVNASIHLPVSGAPPDAAYAIGSYLSDAKHEQETSSA
jgi:hypothetical protein